MSGGKRQRTSWWQRALCWAGLHDWGFVDSFTRLGWLGDTGWLDPIEYEVFKCRRGCDASKTVRVP